jgi:putative ABC transport system substrate-binding protein
MRTATDRRNVILTICASVLGYSTTAFAQKPMPVVGRVYIGKREDTSGANDAFLQGLAKTGYRENQNVTIEWRFLEGQYDRLASTLAELIDRQVAVIVVPGSAGAAIAAKEATKTIPVVFMTGADPVEVKLVASLAKPGGNATGVFLLHGAVIAKRVDLFRLLVPGLTTFGLLTNPINPAFNQAERKAFEDAARSLGLELVVASASNQTEIDASFPKLIAQGARAVAVGADSVFFLHRSEIAALASRYAIPAVGGWSEYADAGGLMSYATSNNEAHALTGYFAGRLLSGEKPSEMPVQQVTKFELVINLATAKALGLAIPDKLLALADKVIE